MIASDSPIGPRWGALAAAAVAALLSVFLAWQQARDNNAQAQAKAAQAASALADQVVQRIGLYHYGLLGARGHFLSVSEQTSKRELFHNYMASRDIDREFPGARGFGFIRRVPLAQEAAFLAEARQDGWPDFAIRQLTPHAFERYVIQYIEPIERNGPAVGLDIASEVSRKAAADAAIITGETRLTAPITLVQATGLVQRSFLILLPIYYTWATPDTPDVRVAAGFGWAYAPLVMDEVLAGLDLDAKLYNLRLTDVSPDISPTEFFANHSRTGADAEPALFNQPLVREVFGRQWRLDFSVRPAYIQQLNQVQPSTVLGLGGVISLLLAVMTYALMANQQARARVAAQTRRLASMVECSMDGIVGLDLQGRVTSWNRGAEQLFGYSASQAVGASLTELIVPGTLFNAEAALFTRLLLGETQSHFNTQRRRRDGSVLDVSVFAAPIYDHQNEVVAAFMTLRDISAQKQAQLRILELNHNLEGQVVERTAELDLARRSLQTLLDAVPSVIGYWDHLQVNKIANQAHVERFGVLADRVPGMHLSELLGVAQYNALLPRVAAALGGAAQRFEFSAPGDDGTEKHYFAQCLPDVTASGVRGFYWVEHDITEITESRLRLSAALQENQVLLTTINKQLLYSVTDAQGAILDVNDNFCLASGYSREQLLGQDHRLINSATHPESFWQDMWRCINGGEAWRGEICNRSRSGELRWFDSVVAPFKDAEGKIQRFVALRTDITQRKQVEASHQAVNRLLRHVLDAASEIAIIATDPEGIITVFNAGAEHMLGYSAAEMVGLRTPAQLHRDDEVAARSLALSAEYGVPIEGFRAFVHKAEVDGVETRPWTYLRKDGGSLTVSLAVSVMRDSQGQILGYLGVAIDISETLAHQRQLLAARDRLNVAAEVAELGVWTLQPGTQQLTWNPRMYEIYQQPMDFAEGQLHYNHWRALIHPDDLAATEAHFAQAVQGQGGFAREFRILTPQGDWRYVQVGAHFERDGQGRVIAVTGINRDITPQRELENQLRQAKEDADAANQAKSQFLATMSHEIRTPMNAVLGMLRLVQGTPLSLRQQDYVQKAETAAKSLLGIINDILDFSKIDAGKLNLDLHPFNLEDLLAELAVVLAGTLENKPVELVLQIPPDMPAIWLGDRLRLQQVLTNLAGNAVKFTQQGQVLVRVERRQGPDGTPRLGVQVSDTGIGISPEQQTRIFQGFVQAEASTSRRFGGTGLGLSISQRLVHLMGGELQLHSQLGVGSDFSFELDWRCEPGVPLLNPDPEANSLPALLVCAHQAQREQLALCLRHLGYQVSAHSQADAALAEALTQNLQGQAFAVCVSDGALLDTQGQDLLRHLQEPQASPAPCPVIALRPLHPATDPAASSLLLWHLATPWVPKGLAQVLALARAGEPQTARGQSPEAPARPLQGLHLLVVEDNPLNRQVAEELLSDLGAQVTLACGGLEGVEKATASKAYDAVLMDLQMPDIDGLEATRRIRQIPGFAKLPIVAMTANASDDDKQACAAAGMNGHLSKPIELEQLTRSLLQLCARRSAATANTSKAAVEPYHSILKRFGGKAELFQRMLRSFGPEIHRLINSLEDACQRQCPSDMTIALHSIKGVSATMGALDLARAAAELEKHSKQLQPEQRQALIEAQQRVRLRRLAEEALQQLQRYPA
jgi:PAS domain S-box-containing protein